MLYQFQGYWMDVNTHLLKSVCVVIGKKVMESKNNQNPVSLIIVQYQKSSDLFSGQL